MGSRTDWSGGSIASGYFLTILACRFGRGGGIFLPGTGFDWHLEVPASPSSFPAMANADPRFNEFVILQAQNAGLFLGQIPHPGTGEKSVNLRAARSVLDSLEMLEVKTQGNLTETEAKLLSTALANLRALYEKASG